jgi:phasin
MSKLFDNTYSTAFEGMREYSLKVFEIARTNADLALKFAEQIVSAKSPSEMIELSTTHYRNQFEALTAQTKELVSLGQKVAATSREPLTSGIAKAFTKVA